MSDPITIARDIAIIGTCVTVALWCHHDRSAKDAEVTALQQIAESLKHPPDAPWNGECHQTLALFDEWLKHDLKSGGSGRAQCPANSRPSTN